MFVVLERGIWFFFDGILFREYVLVSFILIFLLKYLIIKLLIFCISIFVFLCMVYSFSFSLGFLIFRFFSVDILIKVVSFALFRRVYISISVFGRFL